MTEEMQHHFAQAAECIEDAQVLLDHDRLAATAALLAEEIRRTSHHRLLSAFGECLVKTGRISRESFEYLREAFELRQQTDYEPLADVGRETARESLNHALYFIAACRELAG